MSVFGKGKLGEALEEVSRLRGQVEFLEHQSEAARAHNDTLVTMIEKLQDALIAKESPAAYGQLLADRTEESNPLGDEQKRKLLLEHETYNYLAAQEEKPLFDSPDDMIDRLRNILGTPEPESVHGNDES